MTTAAEERPLHSPLGGSGTHRWIPCPGSVRLAHAVEYEKKDYTTLGVAAHHLADYCITAKFPAWETVGATIDDSGMFYPSDLSSDMTEDEVMIDKEMADAVQEYLDAIEQWHPDRTQENSWVERSFYCPDIHEYFWGKADFTFLDLAARTLYVWDYKHGAGIMVDVPNNPQLMYYGCGMLEDLDIWDKIDKVVLFVVQPRGFHFDGPIRMWSIDTDDLMGWMDDTLVPAMDRALTSNDTASGEHCRFCPARYRACPQLLADMAELEKLMKMKLSEKDQAAELSNKDAGRFLDLLDIAKIVGKAANETVYARLLAGKGEGTGRKLVKARANRIYRDDKDAKTAALLRFGKDAMTKPALKSPAQMEAMPKGKAFVAEYAHKPDVGLQAVPEDDSRPEISRDTKSLFKPVPKKGRKKS